jgi:hypothetical protein
MEDVEIKTHLTKRDLERESITPLREVTAANSRATQHAKLLLQWLLLVKEHLGNMKSPDEDTVYQIDEITLHAERTYQLLNTIGHNFVQQLADLETELSQERHKLLNSQVPYKALRSAVPKLATQKLIPKKSLSKAVVQVQK